MYTSVIKRNTFYERMQRLESYEFYGSIFWHIIKNDDENRAGAWLQK
jgi:hypothetical protein